MFMKTNILTASEMRDFHLCYTPTALTEEQYVNSISTLIERTRILDATVVPHNEEELTYRYDKSLIITNGFDIIGHLSLYASQIPEIQELAIGEIGSVIIESKYRSHGLGEKLVTWGINMLWEQYSSLVAATVNFTMEKILTKHAFESIPFPDSYYNAGKKYLSPLMGWWEWEFQERARFMVLERVIGTKKQILELTKK